MEDGRRRFGAMRHHTSRMHAQRSDDSRPANTLEFSTVAAERSVPRHRDNFHFGGGDGRDRQLEGPHAPSKYTSGARPKASGQSISAPGSSITSAASSSSLTGVSDGVLRKVFIPPKTQSSFLDNLTNMTKKNTMQNRGVGTKNKLMAYSTPASSLEVASAPAPKRDVSRLHTGSSGWVNTRAKQPASKPRTLLTSTEERAKLNNSGRKTSPPVVRHYSLRDRNKSSLFGHSPTSTAPFSVRNSRATRLGKRKLNSEGSAAKPIALDSDSDSELEVQSRGTSRSEDFCGKVLNVTRQNGAEQDQEVKSAAIDLDDMAMHAMARIDNCDMMIGLFQCIVDLIFQGDRVCMRNIRGKNEKWPFKEYYILNYDQLRDVRLYSVSKEIELSAEIGAEEGDMMEQLLDEASFMIFKLPFPEEADQVAMKTFYDPAGSDVPKGYMVLRPSEDATGGDLNQIQDHLRAVTDVQAMEDKKQAKEHLQALLKDPFSYQSSRRSRRRRRNGADADSPSESEEDDVEGSITVLTYPLPPCTSDIVTIIRRDVSRLKPRRYLNDNIIDYYFKRMMLDSFRDNKIVQEKVLFLSSHFYSRLRSGKGSTARERMKAGYKNVSNWLARSNFFNRSIIFIPINKDLHWSLAVILNPSIAGSDANNEEAFSCIAVLDPLGSYHRKAAIIRNLKAFLRMQWENSQGRVVDDSVPEYGVDRVLTVNVKAPQQENSYDCGVYVLKFAEVILKNCLELDLLGQNEGVIGKAVTDEDLDALITPSAFSAEDITSTRKQIQQYIEADAREDQALKNEEKAKVPKFQQPE
ncbi:hypothetical protein PHYPSEUDO_006421 [Phytophthora pseudosyringae]|uniref:Ubiquitin-like protease family profile domain-containing protein n=1 Tax=Phytophthora pseudosyringae TaxID=221518 RepID=A0A8T1VLZ2_9STRA|nr:hypothetical protein PHYPSEUDO_006421 [Phytophthora pseudosyringae]